MPEILEGKFHRMPSDPKAIKAVNRAIFLFPFFIAFCFVLGQLAYLGGAWIGVTLFGGQ